MSMTAADLEIERTSQEAWMPDTVVVKRRVETRDSAGGTEIDYTTIPTTYACRIAESKSGALWRYRGETNGGTRLEGMKEWIISMRYDADIKNGDLLEINGRILHVTAILTIGEQRTVLRMRATG